MFPILEILFFTLNLMICCVLTHTRYSLEGIFEAWKMHLSLSSAFERLPTAENLSWQNSFCFLWSNGYNWNWVYLARRGCKWNGDGPSSSSAERGPCFQVPAECPKARQRRKPTSSRYPLVFLLPKQPEGRLERANPTCAGAIVVSQDAIINNQAHNVWRRWQTGVDYLLV